MYSAEELDRLLEPDVLAACAAHADEDAKAFAMRFGKHHEWPVRAMAELIDARKRAALKLHGWPCATLLFDRLGIEQCSHLACAAWRGRALVGSRVVDGCGGLGIDSAALAEHGCTVTHCEIDAERQRLAAYNHRALGLAERIEHHAGDGIARALADDWDVIFLDPARRDDHGRRSIDLDRLQPAPGEHHAALRERCGQLIYKLAPATDGEAIRTTLGHDAHCAWISVDGELKECLATFGSGLRGHSAICLAGSGQELLQLHQPSDGMPLLPASRSPEAGDILLLTDPALNKAGLGGILAAEHGWVPLRAASGLWLSDHPSALPAIRQRRVLAVCSCKYKLIRAACRQHGITAARIIDRGAGLVAGRLQQDCKLAPSDAHQVILTEGPQGRIAILCATMS